jgi:hypothetical protein
MQVPFSVFKWVQGNMPGDEDADPAENDYRSQKWFQNLRLGLRARRRPMKKPSIFNDMDAGQGPH